VHDRSTASADEIDISGQISTITAREEVFRPADVAIDVKGLESACDGSRLVHAVRAIPQSVEANLQTITWADNPSDRSLIVNNQNPRLRPSIVINYPDHLQAIWEHVRQDMDDGAGKLVMSDREDDEEVNKWKLGISAFF
jgi:hypothetical protein